MVLNLRAFDVFICHKKSSGLDFAKHLKKGLEELGIHAFFDSEDIPQRVDGKEEWANIRDRAIQESRTFILIMTPGFELSSEVKKEIAVARNSPKQYIYFRQRDLGRKIIIDLGEEKLDISKQQQVSFETKEELLRLAHRILLKNQVQRVDVSANQLALPLANEIKSARTGGGNLKCMACQKTISGQPYTETVNGKKLFFDSVECARTYRKLKIVYGEIFE